MHAERVRDVLAFGVKTDDLKTLLNFLDLFGPEAAGRGTPKPQIEVATKLDRFAQGQCSDRERAEICEMLRLHPAWLRWLAERVKDARTDHSAFAHR
jgi:hypothetical protein